MSFWQEGKGSGVLSGALRIEALAAQAAAAGLMYVSDSDAGIRRVRCGRGFRYVGPNKKAIADKAELERIARLAIPPAYTDVWICPCADGHIQATGRDAKGRKQYRYHPLFREIRESTK